MPEGKFDPLEPFASKELLQELVDDLAKFRYKLYGPIRMRFHRGEPTKYEFDLNLGVLHFTEQDFRSSASSSGRRTRNGARG